MRAGLSGAPSPDRVAILARGLYPYVLLAPLVLWLGVVVFYPVASALHFAFYSTRQLIPRASDYVGVHNYLRLLTDISVLHALRTTVIYATGTVMGPLVIGLGVALVMNAKFPGQKFLRPMVMIPWALPVVASMLVWKWMLAPQGIVNYVFVRMHLLARPEAWLDSPILALPTIIAIDTWSHFPFASVGILAALQGVDPALYDASKVDGASSVQTFYRVTLPSIAPVVGALSLFLTVWSLQRFTSIWLLTEGGPVDQTTVLAVRIYREAFINFDAGYASAIASIGLILGAVAAVGFLTLANRPTE
jgi:multiple sugar transport system permease protein